jgi:hypothetical protein
MTAWVNAQRMLQPMSVAIPYARYLLRSLPNKPLRMRRDCKKLLTFIAASAALHQYQRDKTDSGKVVANLADYFVGKVLFEDIFFQSLYGVHPNTAKVMDAIKSEFLEPIRARNLMEKLGWDKNTVHKWATPLKQYDWIEENGVGKEHHFKVGIDPRQSSCRLPDIEALAEQFPELAKAFSIVHPLTGETLKLGNYALKTEDQLEAPVTV